MREEEAARLRVALVRTRQVAARRVAEAAEARAQAAEAQHKANECRQALENQQRQATPPVQNPPLPQGAPGSRRVMFPADCPAFRAGQARSSHPCARLPQPCETSRGAAGRLETDAALSDVVTRRDLH